MRVHLVGLGSTLVLSLFLAASDPPAWASSPVAAAAPELSLGGSALPHAVTAPGGSAVPRVSGAQCIERCDRFYDRCIDRSKDLHEEGECAWERQECRSKCPTEADGGT